VEAETALVTRERPHDQQTAAASHDGHRCLARQERRFCGLGRVGRDPLESDEKFCLTVVSMAHIQRNPTPPPAHIVVD